MVNLDTGRKNQEPRCQEPKNKSKESQGPKKEYKIKYKEEPKKI